jgi:hypothetical protein
MQIFDPAEHEPLVREAWDRETARRFIAQFTREADDRYNRHEPGGWPLHREDRYDAEQPRESGVYCGTAGTIWAITHLASLHGIALQHDYEAAIVQCEKAYRDNPAATGTVIPSYFRGTVGIMTAAYAVTGDPSILPRLAADVASNAANPARETMWGASGTALAALLIRERDGDERFDEDLRAVQNELWATWRSAGDVGGLLWEQRVFGQRRLYVGAAHGAIGNLAPFIRASDLLTGQQLVTLDSRIAALLSAYAIIDGDAANWVTIGHPREGNRLQWDHGAAGVILGLARYPDHDELVERLLRAGGEAIWRAGPVGKGPGICHGTAGNGFALLRLAKRTGDLVWQERAEQFAMAAMRQSEAWRSRFGLPSFSLWTGDAGVALFVDAVLRNDPRLLSLDLL